MMLFFLREGGERLAAQRLAEGQLEPFSGEKMATFFFSF